MTKFNKGDRVKVALVSGYILSQNQRRGTVKTVGVLGTTRIDVELDNYSGGSLTFLPEALVKEIPKKITRVKVLGVPLVTIVGDFE